MTIPYHRRKKFLINKRLQLRYAAYTFVTLAIVSIIATACLSLGVWNILAQEFSQEKLTERLEMASQMSDYQRARTGHNMTEDERLRSFDDVQMLSFREKEIFSQVLKENNKQLLLKLIILLLALCVATIFLTHKIAGPLFRLKKTFDAVSAGNLTARLHFRKGDHIQEISPDFNEMISSLDYSYAKCKAYTGRLWEELDRLEVSSEAIEEAKQELQKELNRYKATNEFRF